MKPLWVPLILGTDHSISHKPWIYVAEINLLSVSETLVKPFRILQKNDFPLIISLDLHMENKIGYNI